MSKSSKQLLIEAVGWYGTAAILVAYSLVNLNLLPVHSIWNILLNLTGSVGLLMVATLKRAGQLVILNIVWIVVALIALARLFL
jgi:hypothetical protein